MAKTKVWIITTSGDRPIRNIAKDLADAGLIGGRVLAEVRCITGSAGDKVVAKLGKVPGSSTSPRTPQSTWDHRTHRTRGRARRGTGLSRGRRQTTAFVLLPFALEAPPVEQ